MVRDCCPAIQVNRGRRMITVTLILATAIMTTATRIRIQR